MMPPVDLQPAGWIGPLFFGGCGFVLWIWWRHRLRQIAEIPRFVLDRPFCRDDLIDLPQLQRLIVQLGQAVDWRPDAGKNRRFWERRPGAWHIWSSRSGTCGDLARLLIVLCSTIGIRARRVYIEGERWGHVVVEVDGFGVPVIADGHADPVTRLTEGEQLTLTAANYVVRPTAQIGNRWIGYGYWSPRLRWLLPLPCWNRLKRVRPPRWVTLSMEILPLEISLVLLSAVLLGVLCC